MADSFSNNNEMSGRRKFLVAATSVAGGIASAAIATPFLLSMMPSERAKAAGAPVEVDISKLEPGMLLMVEWRGKVVWVLNRTPEMLETLVKVEGELADPNSEKKQQPEYAKNRTRSIKPQILVTEGVCTHLGCFFCPCHGSKFDLAGRVYKSVPAPSNMVVPPHTYLSDDRLLIGSESEGSA